MFIVETNLDLSDSNILFHLLHGALGFITIHHSINVNFLELSQCFTIRLILSFYAIRCVFDLYINYGYSNFK